MDLQRQKKLSIFPFRYSNSKVIISRLIRLWWGPLTVEIHVQRGAQRDTCVEGYAEVCGWK